MFDFSTKYRIVPGMFAGYMPQSRKWFQTGWHDLCYYSCDSLDMAQRVINYHTGVVLWSNE